MPNMQASRSDKPDSTGEVVNTMANNTAICAINSDAIRMAIKRLIPAIFLILFAQAAVADNSKKFGDYTVYYNAFTSDSLQPAMAKAYNITRSKNRGLLSISILKKSLSPLGTPVKASVKASATNLTGQLKSISIREVEDGNSVYYLSEFHVSHQEVLDFILNIVPAGTDTPLTVKFRQQFYTQ